MDDYLAEHSYSLDMIPRLEEYLEKQVNGSVPYHADANRTLIKLYHLFGNYKADNCATCCVIGLLEGALLPLIYLLPTSILQQDTMKCVQDCNELFEGCQFADFWTQYEKLQSSSNQAVKVVANRGVATLQARVLETLALSYARAPRSVVSAALNSNDLPSSPYVESADASSVVFCKTAHNTHRETVFQESVGFGNICSLMNTISHQ